MSVHQSDWRLGRTTHFSPTYISASTKIIALYIGALGAGVIISTFTLLIYQYFLSLCRLRPQLTHKNGGKVGENFKFRAVTFWFWKMYRISCWLCNLDINISVSLIWLALVGPFSTFLGSSEAVLMKVIIAQYLRREGVGENILHFLGRSKYHLFP